MTTITKAIVGAGSLTKLEKLKEINSKLANTTVLEVEEPFPGYYHEVPVMHSINSVFLIVESGLFPENILRATNKVRSSCQIEFDAAYARLRFEKSNQTFVAIRLRNIKSYDDIKALQEKYASFDIAFEKELKLDLSQAVIININKVYTLSSVVEGIYTDDFLPEFLFLELSKGGDWSWFEKLTHRVKNNFARKNFDAAQTVIYKKGGLIELVRIFDDKMTIEEAISLRNMYNSYS